MTAPMRPPAPSRWADAVPVVTTITTAPTSAAAELTRNASSWELLDMVAHGGSAAALSTTSHAETCGGGIASPPSGAAGAASGEDSSSPASPQSREPSTGRVRGTSPEPPLVLLQLLDAEGTRSLPRVATANAASAACNAAAPAHLLRHAHSGGAVPKRHRHRSGSPRHGDGPLLSPAHSISTVWSLISTPSQTHLPASHDDAAPFVLAPTAAAATDAAPATTGGYTVSTASSPSRHHRASQFLVAANAGGVSTAAVSPLPADAPAMIGAWRVESLPSSLPLEVHHHGHHIDVPPSASSYGACSAASGGTRASAANPMLVPRVVSVATTSLTSEGEACLGESNHTGSHSPVAAENTTTTTTLLTPTPAAGAVLLGALEPPHATSDRGTPRCADVAAFPSSHADSQAAAVETPEPGFAWLPKHLVELCDRRRSATPSHDPDTGSDAAQAEQAGTASQRRQREQRRAAAWLSYRISFLSSSSLVASLRSAGVTGGVAQPAQDPATAAASHCSAEAPTHSAPSYAAFTVETSWLWSRAGVVCSSGSRRALRGLNRVCAFVWQDIKEHWYPQLRLVLGDHSSARKSRRSRRARRRHASLATGAGAEGAPAAAAAAAASCSASDNEGLHEAAVAAAPESMRWRSVSSPCLFNGDVRVTRDSAAHHYMAWKECRACAGATATAQHGPRHSDSNSSSVCAAAVPSAQEGMKLYMAITAEAVASAAQGLLVFLL